MKWIFVGSAIGDKFIIDGIDILKKNGKTLIKVLVLQTINWTGDVYTVIITLLVLAITIAVNFKDILLIKVTKFIRIIL